MRTPVPAALSALLLAAAARADELERVAYDAATDEIVVKIDHRGTNPKHTFTIQ